MSVLAFSRTNTQTFSKVSALAHFLYKATTQSTFENICLFTNVDALILAGVGFSVLKRLEIFNFVDAIAALLNKALGPILDTVVQHIQRLVHFAPVRRRLLQPLPQDLMHTRTRTHTHTRAHARARAHTHTQYYTPTRPLWLLIERIEGSEGIAGSEGIEGSEGSLLGLLALLGLRTCAPLINSTRLLQGAKLRSDKRGQGLPSVLKRVPMRLAHNALLDPRRARARCINAAPGRSVDAGLGLW